MNSSLSSLRKSARVALLAACAPLIASADVARPDSHAPISVMGDHTHHQGEWMTSYRFMHMSMKDNYDGSSKMSPTEVLSSYMIAPLSMEMDMHMIGLMYAPSDKLTLMLMLPYLDSSMELQTRMGMQFTTKSSGWGDISVGGLWTVSKTATDQVHLNLGLSLPTGKLDVRDATPMGANSLLPYPMRLGSGTFDLKPGITWNHRKASWSAGAQASGTIRIGENNRDYRLGNTIQLTSWAARTLTPNLSISARITYDQWGDISGNDSGLNPMMVPTARTDLRGGQRLTTWLGANLIGSKGALTNHRLALEIGIPVYRDLDGPQLGTSLITTLGWQYAY